MKYFFIILITALTGFFLIANAQTIPTLSPWYFSSSTQITTRANNDQVQIPFLGSSGNPCLIVNSNGLISTSTCVASFTTTTINNLSSTNYLFTATGTGLAISTTSPNTITYTWTNPGYITLNSLSASAPIVYNNATGAFTWTNSNNYIILSSLSATNPITYNNLSGAIGWTNSNNYITTTSLSAVNPVTYNTSTGAIGWTNSNNYLISNNFLAGTGLAISTTTTNVTYSNQFVTSSLSAANPITYNNTTGAIGWTNSNNYLISGNFIAGSNITLTTTTNSVTIASTGAVSSVSNSNGTLTISPTTGAVVASLNLGNANTWTAAQTFNANTNFPGSGIWNTSGNVGIGTTTPAYALDVIGQIRNSGAYLYQSESSGNVNGTGGPFIYADANNTVIKLGSTAGNLQIQNYSGSNVNNFSVNGNSWITGGNVGIGTSTPVYLLHVYGASNPAMKIQQASGGNTDFAITSGAGNYFVSGINAGDSIIRYGSGYALRIGNNSAGSPSFTIDSSGNVGIGTTTPNTLLNVSNGTNASIRTGSNGTEQGCLELYTSAGTLTYTYANSNTSVLTTTTKPSFCQ